MPEYEIKSIRKKFILISTLSFCGVMLLMGGFIYLFSTITIRNEVRQIMYRIVEHDGDLPDLSRSGESTGSASERKSFGKSSESGWTGESSESEWTDISEGSKPAAASTESGDTGTENQSEDIDWSLKGMFGLDSLFGESPDFLYTTRYFSVLFDQSGEVEEIKTSHIAYINEEEAENYARSALRRFRRFGNYGRYYYYVAERPAGGTIVTYLDRTTQVAFAQRILFAALILLGFGTLLTFFLMRFFSKDVVRTEIENAEKQKQFITNASHELKTPLAVISANTEMQEMISGETEWTQSTMRQVERMNGLIGNLVKITRAQEMDRGELTEQDIVPFVSETAESFLPVAAGEGKRLEMHLEPALVMKTEEGRIRQLVSLLTDNAVKYCDADGMIRIGLVKSGKTAVLTVSNTYAAGGSVDYSRYFERFYREDEAHTISGGTPEHSGRSGYGIGLSIAENLVKSLKGTIQASWKNGEITFTCRLPVRT